MSLLCVGLILWRFSINGNDAETQELIPVLVAEKYIPAFTAVKKENIALKHLPKAYAPPGILYSGRELFNEQDRPLYTSAIAIPAGQPITQSLLVESAKSKGLGRLLSPGQVALSLSLDSVHGVGGWLQPGDTIALYQGAPVSKLLFPNLTLLAVNKNRLGMEEPVRNSDDKLLLEDLTQESGAVITLRVNSIQAGVIIQAREQGPLTAVLRALGDTDL